MKKLLAVVLCVLMLMPFVFNRVEAMNYYNIFLDYTTSVSIAAGDEARCTFVPEFSGGYSIHSNGSYDTVATLHDADNVPLMSDDDSGDGNNFDIKYYFQAGQTYYIYIHFYESDESGTFSVTVDEPDFFAYAPDRYINPNDNVTLAVYGLVTKQSGTTYEWYRYDPDFTKRDYKETKLSYTTKTITLNKVNKSAEYVCVATTSSGDTYYDSFFVNIPSEFHADMITQPDSFVLDGQKRTVKVATYGMDLTDNRYYWWTYCDGGENGYQYRGMTTSESFSYNVEDSSECIMCIAVDKYNNYDECYCWFHVVDRIVYADTLYTFTDDIAIDMVFVPEITGVYDFVTEGESAPYAIVYDDDFTILEEVYPPNDENFDFTMYMEAGRVYYIQLGYYDFYDGCDFFIVGPMGVTNNKLMLNARNEGNTIKVIWAGIKAATKFNLYRRVKGTSSWTTVKSNAGKIGYADGDNLKMGTTYEYSVRYYKNGSWSGYSTPVQIVRNPFIDVPNDHAHFKFISWAFNNKIVNGGTESEFFPDDPCERGQFCIMLWRLCGKPSVSGTCPFVDIGTLSANTQKAIIWAYKKGIVKGVDSTHFDPYGYTTRGQMAIMLWRVAGKPNVSGTCPFTDISGCTANMQKAIIWAYKKGITKGTSATTYGPDEDCTRSQLTCFFYRLNNLLHLIK